MVAAEIEYAGTMKRQAERDSAPERLDPARTCLLLCDLLEGHVNKDPGTRKRLDPVVANAEALLAAARRTDAMVAYAHADPRADWATRTIRDADERLAMLDAGGGGEARVVRELAPEPGDYLVPKHRWSAFQGTYLDLALRARRIDTIVLCGASTDMAVASTAFAASDLDYNLVVVSDACTSPEQDNHLQFMRRVFPRMARVRTTGQVLDMLQERP